VRIELFARTEVGCVRERNEDAFVVADLEAGATSLAPDARNRDVGGGFLIGVCDGMGGAAAGDVASSIAAEQLKVTLTASAPYRDSASAQSALLQSVSVSNRAIGDFARQHPERQGMGTTMTAALIFGPDVHIVHVGDSRAYLRRGRAFTQLTTDHSVVGQMIASGQLSPEQARSYEHRNVLLQALGVQPVVQPELVIATVRVGDVLLLCSDGLTGPLTDEDVMQIMLRFEDPVRACRALTEAACAAGGPDNVTVAIVRFGGDDLGLPQGREPIAIHRANHVVHS